MHGMPGFPGAPGRDGRDGAKGDLGRPGKNGPQGPRGVDGKKGAKGNKGDSGTPRLSSHMNWKECTWKKGDHRDSGEIHVSYFLYFHSEFCVLRHTFTTLKRNYP